MGQNEKVILVQGEFEDTTGVIRIRKSKNRQHNGQQLEDTTGQSESVYQRTDNTMAKRKSTNNDLQSIHI